MDLQIKQVTASVDILRAFSIRRTVFQFEQGVAEDLEFDGLDDQAEHFLACLPSGEAIATARVRYLEHPSLQSQKIAKIERLAVLSPYRGQAVGKYMMQFIIQHLQKQSISKAKLNAQVSAQGFYEKLGFHPHGPTFDEAGMAHVEMYHELALA